MHKQCRAENVCLLLCSCDGLTAYYLLHYLLLAEIHRAQMMQC